LTNKKEKTLLAPFLDFGIIMKGSICISIRNVLEKESKLRVQTNKRFKQPTANVLRVSKLGYTASLKNE